MAGALLHLEHVTNVTLRGPGVLYGNAEQYIGGYLPKDDEFEPISPDGSRPRVVFTHNATDLRFLDGLQVRNASDWHVHLQASANILIDGIHVEGRLLPPPSKLFLPLCPPRATHRTVAYRMAHTVAWALPCGQAAGSFPTTTALTWTPPST